MAGPRLISCPLCLCANESDSLLTFPIEHHAILKNASASICQSCTEAICVAVAERADAALAAAQADQVAGEEKENTDNSEATGE